MKEKEWMSPCLTCGCYDEDYGCTMPSVDMIYACSLYSTENEYKWGDYDDWND